jgi:hypothetical protein
MAHDDKLRKALDRLLAAVLLMRSHANPDWLSKDWDGPIQEAEKALDR